MAEMSDFFPGGIVRFVPPHYDERYWSHFGIPASVQVGKWGSVCARGLQYATTGAAVASGTAGVVRKISTARKARGYASGTPEEVNDVRVER